MKLLILYRPTSEQARQIESFIRDFKATHEAQHVEALDIDSREGMAMASLYDVLSNPVILALRDDGTVLKSWEGDMLPLMDEVAYYTMP